MNEFERLKNIYPLFKFELKDNQLAVHNNSSTTYYSFTNDRLDFESQHQLDNDHMIKTISRDLMVLYPDLAISAYGGKDGILISAWVLRDNRDAEAIGHIPITKQNLHDILKTWQLEAHQSKQDGWFYCSGHNKAEPQIEYGYFHFAGKYCKRHGEENPASLREARNETYN